VNLDDVPVAGVAGVPPGRIVLAIDQVIGDLTIQCGFQQPLGQLLQNAAALPV
jgi:hypothetical protein